MQPHGLMTRSSIVLGIVSLLVAAGCATVSAPTYPRTGDCEVPRFRSEGGVSAARMIIVNTGHPCRIQHFSDVDAQIPASDVHVVSEPANGTVRVDPPNAVWYTPRPGFVGTDRFSYEATGTNRAGSAGTSHASIDVTVLAPRSRDRSAGGMGARW